MKKWRIKSLMLRTWLIFAGALLFFTVVFGSIIYHVTMRDATEQMLEAHRMILYDHRNLGGMVNRQEGLEHYWLRQDREDGEVTIAPAREKAHESEGHRFQRGKNRDLPMIDGRALDGRNTYLMQGESGGMRYVISYVDGEGDDESTYLLSTQQQMNHLLLLPMLVLVLILALLGQLVAIIMAHYIVRPLKVLERYAQRIAHKQWGQPLAITSGDEVGRLMVAMNEMQALLKQNEEEQTAFLQSISHDLKTPIAVILGHSQAIMDGIYIESLDHTAEVIKEEALRLNSKVKKILYFNTLDYSLENQHFLESIELAEFLSDLVARFKPLAPTLNWILEAKPLRIVSDGDTLQVALENIVDNAQRYGRTVVKITLTALEDGVEIAIYNDGEQIPAEKLTGIFDHLAKGKKGNFGLGLFISQKIINYNQGELTAENTSDGVCFRVKLPYKATS